MEGTKLYIKIPGERIGALVGPEGHVKTAIEKKLLIGSAAAQSDVGVTVSYGMIAEKTGRQASRLAGLLLSGRSPTDIPSEIADFYLGVNLNTAEASGIEIPATILQQADIIIR